MEYHGNYWDLYNNYNPYNKVGPASQALPFRPLPIGYRPRYADYNRKRDDDDDENSIRSEQANRNFLHPAAIFAMVIMMAIIVALSGVCIWLAVRGKAPGM